MRIKELRTELNLTQFELAKAINTSQRNISRWENGENEPTASFISALAEFFSVSVSYLLGTDSERFLFTPESLPKEYMQKKPQGEQLTKEEQELLRTYRAIDEELQHRALAYMRKLAELTAEEYKAPSGQAKSSTFGSGAKSLKK